MQVAGKVVVITGAGSGIGRALAVSLVSRGAVVAGADLNQATLDETAGLVHQQPGSFHGYACNVADRAAVEAMRDKVLESHGFVDIVINTAGVIQPFIRLNDLDYSTIEHVFQVNFFGTLFITKAFLPHLLARPEAHIVNLSSMGGFVPVPGQTIYCAAKAAVKFLSEGLAVELMGTKVHVTVVCPGAVKTNIRSNSGVETPSRTAPSKGGMIVSAEEAARIIIRGIERNAALVFVGRDAAIMDKLYRFRPAFASQLIAKKMKGLLPA